MISTLKKLRRNKNLWDDWQSKAKGPIWNFRMATWRWRTPPALLILGAQKAGTTSLANYLDQHPQFFVSKYAKEIHFFDTMGGKQYRQNFELGMPWYLAHWDMNPVKNGPFFNFDATPYYLYQPVVPSRIHATLPNVKMVVILRNPIDRAISQYHMNIRKGTETLPLEQAIYTEEDRIAVAQQNKIEYFQDLYYVSYKDRGKYAEQLKRYFDLFSREQFLIFRSEELKQKPLEVLDRIYQFVGADSDFKVPQLEHRNVTENPTPTDPKLREYLRQFFVPYNQQLSDLLEQDFSDWNH